MLSYVLKHGNVSVYEWKHGNGPPATTMSATTQSSAVTAESADIDWGDDIGELYMAIS